MRIRTWLLSFRSAPHMAFQPVGAMGRWNCQGVPLVYTAQNPAAAALELVAAWVMLSDLPGYYLHSCSFAPADVQVVPPELDVTDLATTRAFGSTWAEARQSVVLKVPSSVIRGTSCYLVNPRHPLSADRVWLARRGRLHLNIDPLIDAGTTLHINLLAHDGTARNTNRLTDGGTPRDRGHRARD